MSTLKKSGDEKVKELQKTIDAMKEEETRVKTNMVSNILKVATFVKLISSENINPNNILYKSFDL